MAFTAGIKRPQQSNNTAQNKQNSVDRPLTVTGYDLPKQYIYCEDEKGKKYEVYVNRAEYQRAEDSAAKNTKLDRTTNWMGHSVDKAMVKSIPVGSKIIVLRSKVISKDKVRDIAVTEVHRIVGVPNPEPDKTFPGIFTITYRRDENTERANRLQHWDKHAINLNDSEKLEQLKDRIDEARKNYGKKMGEFSITEPTVGIQFRASIKTDRTYPLLDNRPIYEVVDESIIFDWIRPDENDENGVRIKANDHVLTGDEFMSFAEQYIEHISNNAAFKDNLDNMRVEVAPFNAYPISRNDFFILTTGEPEKDKNADKSPLYQLAHATNYVDMEQTELQVGGNRAVNGIVQIASNKLEKVNGKPVEVPNYWVNKLHANNTRGNVHAFIRSVDEEGLEYKTEVHPLIDLILTEQQKLAKTKRAEETSSAPTETTISTSAPVAVKEEMESDEFNPFETPVTSPAEVKPKLTFGTKK